MRLSAFPCVVDCASSARCICGPCLSCPELARSDVARLVVRLGTFDTGQQLDRHSLHAPGEDARGAWLGSGAAAVHIPCNLPSTCGSSGACFCKTCRRTFFHSCFRGELDRGRVDPQLGFHRLSLAPAWPDAARRLGAAGSCAHASLSWDLCVVRRSGTDRRFPVLVDAIAALVACRSSSRIDRCRNDAAGHCHHLSKRWCPLHPGSAAYPAK